MGTQVGRDGNVTVNLLVPHRQIGLYIPKGAEKESKVDTSTDQSYDGVNTLCMLQQMDCSALQKIIC